MQDNNLLPLFRLKIFPKGLKTHIWASRFSKFSGGACPRTPLEKRGLRPRVIASRSHHLSCSHLTLVTAPGPHSNPGSATAAVFRLPRSPPSSARRAQNTSTKAQTVLCHFLIDFECVELPRVLFEWLPMLSSRLTRAWLSRFMQGASTWKTDARQVTSSTIGSRLAHGSQCDSHHASWWKVKKVVLDQSVLFDEVIGGSLQRAFALRIFLFCSARALVKIITRWRVLSMTAPSTSSYKLAGYLSWKLGHHLSLKKKTWKTWSGKIDARKGNARCVLLPWDRRDMWQRLAEMRCELCWATARSHAQPTRMQHASLGLCAAASEPIF